MTPDRRAELRRFVEHHCRDAGPDIVPASADASFRSYWRVTTPARTLVVMDAPPTLEDTGPWLDIGKRLRDHGLHTPAVYAVDRAAGFILMEDLGTRTYLPELSDATVDALYDDALDALFTMQRDVDASDLAPFDTGRLRDEMALLVPWLLERHLGRRVDAADAELIDAAVEHIAASVARQPTVFMHRDYHSRNLLVTAHESPGIIDFQGAVNGPLTYDLVSLLRDCYITWPAARVDDWVERYRRRLVDAGITNAGATQFHDWFDFAGLQRHIKVLGLFCRLCYRDGKPAYLHDLPRVLDYVLTVANAHDATRPFARMLERVTESTDLTRVRAAAASGGDA
jgi:aminoglycoside/choline kinase family phosphotransferase